MRLAISLRGLRVLLISVVALLVVAGFVAEYAAHYWHTDSDLIDYFNLNGEQNVPTWWSSYLLLGCAVACWAIAKVKGHAGEYRRHWVGLAVIFCYISIDEMVQIHEQLTTLPGLKSLYGVWYYSWVVVAIPLVAAFALSYVKFLVHLPMKTRYKVALSGLIYVGGALGVEIILGAYTDKYGADSIVWDLIDLVEESMEMIGSSLFLYALLEYLGGLAPDLAIIVRSADDGATKRP